MLIASQHQIIGDVAIKDLSAHVLDPDGDYVYDMGFEQPEISCCREKIPCTLCCGNEITVLQHI